LLFDYFSDSLNRTVYAHQLCWGCPFGARATNSRNVITGCHCGNLGADFFGTPYYGHDRMQIPDNAAVSTGDLVAYYDDE
jgi:hypothetical protein